jgi:hypothetical protein
MRAARHRGRVYDFMRLFGSAPRDVRCCGPSLLPATATAHQHAEHVNARV